MRRMTEEKDWRRQLKMFGELQINGRGRKSKVAAPEERGKVTETVTFGASAIFAVYCDPPV